MKFELIFFIFTQYRCPNVLARSGIECQDGHLKIFRILLGWVLEGRVCRVTQNLHSCIFSYSTITSQLNLSPLLPDPPDWIYCDPPPINFTLKSSHDQINHEHPLPQSNFVWPTLHTPAPLPQLIFFFACLSYIIFTGKALRKVYHHSALLLLEKV